MIARISLFCGLALALAGCDGALQKSAAATSQSTEEEAAEPLPEQVSFHEHIQPILTEYCDSCHGPDSAKRKPKNSPLRLDRVEDAFALRDDGRPVIIKGEPAESKLMSLIRSADPDQVMPPPKSRKTLKRREIALLERWIEQGADYGDHSTSAGE